MSRTFAASAKRFFCMALCAGLLSGCSGQNIQSGLQEIEQMELAETVGADEVEGKVIASISTNAEQSEAVPTVLIHQGNSISEALENMPAFTPKRFLFFGHTKHFVLGQAAAEAGIAPYLDYIERVVEMRLDTNLFIVKNGDAQGVITGEGDVSAMLDSIQISVEDQSEGYVYTVGEIAQSLVGNGTALVAAVETAPAEEYQPGTEGEVVLFSGYALILDGKLAAFTDKDVAKGVNLLTDKVRGGLFTVPDGQGGYASLHLSGSALTVEPKFQADGALTDLTIRIRLEANLEGLQNPVDVYDPDAMGKLSQAAAELEKSRVERALAQAQALGRDFFGLGKRVELKNPGAFAVMPQDWESRFPTLPIRVEVSMEIERSYDIGNFVGASVNGA